MTNELDDTLQHYGVKGMRWGHHKNSIVLSNANTSVKLKNGETLSISEKQTTALAKALGAVSPKLKNEQRKTKILTLKDSNGKTIGDMQLYKESHDSLNVVWVGVKNKERGRGYGTAAIQAAISYAKKNKLNKLTLEVPGSSPDARHIYEKLGFKSLGKISNEDDVWGGLTKMELKLQHSDNLNDIIQHHGVKGMKWGVHKSQYRQRVDSNATTSTEGKFKRLGSDINMARYFTRGHIRRSRVKFNEKWYNNLDTGKQFIEKGTTLNRVVRGVDSNVLSGRLYVSKRKDDAKMYRATIPYFQEAGASGKKSYHSVYELELKTKKRLAMPSARERVDAFIETIQKPEGRQWLKDNGYKDQINELNAKEVGFKYYQRFNKYAGDQNLKMNDVYFNSLKQKGYQALLDDNDAGIWSKQPTILLSPKGTVKVTKVRQLTADDINKAQRNVLNYRQYGKG